MSEYIVELDSKHSIALKLAFAEEMRGGDFVREEIVRCRDCKHYDPNDEPSEVYPDRYWCDKQANYMPPDGFCSFGKRKEGGDD